MGKTKDDTSYKKLEDEPKDTGKDKGKSKNGETEEEEKGPPWLWFFSIMSCICMLTGTLTGVPLWIQLTTSYGLCSHLCDGDIVCPQSILMAANIFTFATYSFTLFALPAGVLFDKIGGRAVSVMGGCMVSASWFLMLIPIAGATMGIDSVTWFLFIPIMLLQAIGVRFSLSGISGLLYWFNSVLGLIFTVINTCISLTSLLSLFVAPLVTSEKMLFAVCVFFGIVSMIATFGLRMMMPSVEEYEEQAAEVTGMPVKKNTASFVKIMTTGGRVILANFWDHAFCLATLALAASFQTLYSSVSAQYVVTLLGDPNDPVLNKSIAAQQGSICTVALLIVGVFIAPFLSTLGDKISPKFTPVVMVCITVLIVAAVPIPLWAAQITCALAGQYISLMAGVTMSQRAFAFATANKVGTVTGMLNTGFAFVAMPIGIGIQSFMASLENPEAAYKSIFLTVSIVGVVSMTLWFVQLILVGSPLSPVLLREDEEDICVSYGCKFIDEVLYVLELQDRELLLSLLSSADPDTQLNLVMHINGDRLVEKLMDRNVEEIIESMESGIAWRRKLAIADAGDMGTGMAMVGMGMSGGNLAKLMKVDTSKFGKGEAKTLDQFENEVGKGRSKIIVDEKDPSKMKRLVEVVVLRIYTDKDSSKRLMVQMSEQFPDGRQRLKPQLPGTKRGPNDSVKDCVSSILTKYSMQDISIHFLYDRTEIHEETQESPSYPGVFTVYKKEFIDGYIMEASSEVLERIGLPAAVPWSTFHDKTKYTYLCEWLSDKEATGKGIITSGTKSTKQSEPEKVTLPAGRLWTPDEIIRSLDARDFSKKLVFMLHMEDVDELEHWLLTEDVRNLRAAFRDLEEWTDAQPDAMHTKFTTLIPSDALSNLMRTRSQLKPLVIDFLKSDLLKVQKENADKKKEIKREDA